MAEIWYSTCSGNDSGGSVGGGCNNVIMVVLIIGYSQWTGFYGNS